MEATPDVTNVETALQQALEALNTLQDPILAAHIEPLIRANLARKRHILFLSNMPDSSLEDYVKRVAGFYIQLEAYLHQLQVEKSAEVWDSLCRKMKIWAYNFLVRRKNFTPGSDTAQLAHDYATDAMAAAAKAYFPYDTDFEPWAVVLLQHTCRKHLRQALKRLKTSGQEILPDEAWWGRQSDPHSEQRLRSIELRQDLLEAFNQLAEAEHRLIWLIYFESLKPVEIAEKLGIEISRVYTLKFQALKELRKILHRNGYERS